MIQLRNGRKRLEGLFPVKLFSIKLFLVKSSLKKFNILLLMLLASIAAGVTAQSIERVTRYDYDGAGNTIAINTQEQAGPPSISALSRSFINAGNRIELTAIGENLLGASVLTRTDGLTISNISPSDTSVRFTLEASADIALGNGSLRFVTGLGEAQQNITVAQAPPRLTTTPSPIVIEGNGVNTTLSLTFAEPRPRQEDYSVTIVNTEIVTTTQTTISLAPGQRQANIRLTGISSGITRLEIELVGEPLLYSLPVTVARSFLELLAENPDIGPRSLFSESVGVVIGRVQQTVSNSIFSRSVGITVAESTFATSAYSDTVGIIVEEARVASQAYSNIVGATVGALTDGAVQPAVAAIGTDIIFEITGINLQEVQGVSLSPNTGFAISAFSLNPEGTIIALPVTIGLDVAPGVYEITLSGAEGEIATRLNIPLTFTIE